VISKEHFLDTEKKTSKIQQKRKFQQQMILQINGIAKAQKKN
jgi:hypothetical protein